MTTTGSSARAPSTLARPTRAYTRQSPSDEVLSPTQIRTRLEAAAGKRLANLAKRCHPQLGSVSGLGTLTLAHFLTRSFICGMLISVLKFSPGLAQSVVKPSLVPDAPQPAAT